VITKFCLWIMMQSIVILSRGMWCQDTYISISCVSSLRTWVGLLLAGFMHFWLGSMNIRKLISNASSDVTEGSKKQVALSDQGLDHSIFLLLVSDRLSFESRLASGSHFVFLISFRITRAWFAHLLGFRHLMFPCTLLSC
jgi:hypothetical protein